MEEKTSKNPMQDMLENLQLFQQTGYCERYIKQNNSQIDQDKINENADIASASFRQANEFIISAENASIATNPLLYSYALNNFLKGLAYLKYNNDESLLNQFEKHGFSIDVVNKTLLNTSIEIKKNGAVVFITRIFNCEIPPQSIKFDCLLSQIPELSRTYFKTTGNISNTAQKKYNSDNEYIIMSENYSKLRNGEEILDYMGLDGNYIQDINIGNHFLLGFTVGGKDTIQKEKLEKNLFYKDYLILPNKFEDGLKCMNLMFYCYLTIMGYGMLVRYNAHKWEKFIDYKISSEATLIEQSIKICVEEFLSILHNELFGFIYKDIEYTDKRVKKIIDESTINIMNNITKTIERRNLIYGNNDPLPWRKDLR